MSIVLASTFVRFVEMKNPETPEKLQLHGFNNLTKSLSFNIYDICYAKTPEHRQEYRQYVDELYNAERLTQILTTVTEIVGANILNIARQDYDPQGASVANAEISLVTGAGQRTRSARSNADGGFSIDGVSPGDYTLIVRAPGFTESTQPVSSGSATNLTVTLKIAGVVEDVTVQGALLGTAATLLPR